MIAWAMRKLREWRGINPRDPALSALFGMGANTASGVAVTEDKAMGVVAVFSCVKIIAETVASLPIKVYRRRADDGKDLVSDHPLAWLLQHEPNPEMSAFTFREVMTGHLALRGNALAYIERNGAGRPIALWPLRPDRVALNRVAGELFYTIYVPPYLAGSSAYNLTASDVMESYIPVTVPTDSILHVKGFGSNGMVGYSPITLAREAIGLTMAADEFGARFFGNNSRPGGLLKHPGKLGPEAQARLRESWNAIHSGLSSAHKVAILEEGMDWIKVGTAPDDAQYIQTRKMQLGECARLFGLPLYRLGELEHSSYASIEQQSIDFVVYSMRPWLIRWEQEINRACLTPSEKRQLYVEHQMDALLRGDTKSRYEAHGLALDKGWLSVDEVRALENRTPLPDGLGKGYVRPLNVQVVGAPAAPAALAAAASSQPAPGPAALELPPPPADPPPGPGE